MKKLRKGQRDSDAAASQMASTPSARKREGPGWSPLTRAAAALSPSSVAPRRKLRFSTSPNLPTFSLPRSPSATHPAEFLPAHVSYRRALSSIAAASTPLRARSALHYAGVPPEVREVFDYFNMNRSGFLDYTELVEALRFYGYDASIDESVGLLQQYDDDADGLLSPVSCLPACCC
jgi:hypothetical protein